MSLPPALPKCPIEIVADELVRAECFLIHSKARQHSKVQKAQEYSRSKKKKRADQLVDWKTASLYLTVSYIHNHNVYPYIMLVVTCNKVNVNSSSLEASYNVCVHSKQKQMRVAFDIVQNHNPSNKHHNTNTKS